MHCDDKSHLFDYFRDEEVEHEGQLDVDEKEERSEYEGEGERIWELEQHQWPQKPHQTYMITCVIQHSNSFESSLQWENEQFWTLYQLVVKQILRATHTHTSRVSLWKDTFWNIVCILQMYPVSDDY